MKPFFAFPLILVLIGSLLWITPAKAAGATYSVDPGGSDTSGTGTSANPWKTIQHGADQLTPGDTLLINPGIYSGGITIEDRSGTAANPITFKANGAGVILEGSGGERDAFFITTSDYIVVDGLTIQHATRAGVRIDSSDHVTVRNSVFANNTTWGLFTDFSDYTTVENSESYGAVEQHGIYISNSSDYPIIRHNRLHDNSDCGLHMNGDISMGGDGVISYGLVEGNIIYNNGAGGGSGINMDGVTDTVVRNNLLYNNHASGISLYQIDGGSGSQRDKVLNNTILMPSDGRWAINIGDQGNTNNQVFNNILYSTHSFRGSIATASASLAGFASDYNVVVNRFSDDTGDTNMSLAAWQALGYDQHSLIAVPAQLFANPGANDYHLSASSAAIDRGKTLAEVSDDLEGHARPSGAGYDIGAYELVPSLALAGQGRDQSLYLTWNVNVPLPAGATWQITYSGGQQGAPPSPITGIAGSARSALISGLANNADYTITLSAMQGGNPILTTTIHAMPRAHSLYLPVVRGN